MNTKIVALSASWAVTVGAAYWIGSAVSSEDAAPASTFNAPTISPKKSGYTTSSGTQNSATPGDESTSAPLASFEALTEEASPEAWADAEEALKNLHPWEAKNALDSLLQTPPSQMRDRMIMDLLELWAKQSPDQALAYVGNIESLRQRDRATEQILETWGQNDPYAAMQWLNENSSDLPQRILNDRILSVIEGYAQADPQGAFTYAANLPGDTSMQRRLKQRALRESVQQLVGQNQVSAALSLVSNLPDGSDKQDAFGELIGEWAEYDPAAAAQHLNLLGADASSDARRELVRSWAEYDPVGAAAWLSNLPPDTEETGQLVSELVGRWTQYDLDASAAWLNQIPPTPEIDRAVAIYTFRSAQEDPATAMSWAESVTRDDMRIRLMERVASEWKQQDPEAFQSYINQSQLTEEQKTQLTNAQPWRGFRGGGNWQRD